MEFDFDEIIPRKGTGCVKYDGADVGDRMPLWVADMDFATPSFVLDALRTRLEHPVLGYPLVPRNYYAVISGWVKKLHGWDVPSDSIRFIPGIVKGIGMVLGCFFRQPDCEHQKVKVIIQPPVYHPFRLLPQKNGFEVVENPLIPVEKDGRLIGYRMDFDGLEKLIDMDTKVLILSNPHNPGGICWPEEELRRLAHICAQKGVLVISDEIHAEMALKGYRHVPFASVCEDAAACSISFMAPSKTFNIAGVVSSYAVVVNPTLREKFYAYLDSNEFDNPPIFSSVATMAAYTKGDEWRRQMLEYVGANVDFVENYIHTRIPRISLLRPQASFLVWLDMRGLGLEHDKLLELVLDKAGLFMNDGAMFGEQGSGFFRLNVGCPRSVLEEAMGKLEKAINN